MNKLRKTLTVIIALILVLLCVQLVTAEQGEKISVRVASLKGPTSMGLVGLMNKENTENDYTFEVAGTADAIVPLIAKGDIDIALIPANLSSVLYNNTQGAISVAAVNTLGVLYIVENGETVTDISDLKGKTLYSTGKGTTPEYALNTVLELSGINPETDLTIEYKSEASEVLALITAGQATLAMLPQPFATAALSQVEGLRTALSLTDEWSKVIDSSLITGVMVVRNDFLADHPEAFDAFMKEYEESTAFVNKNPAEASVYIEALGIAKAAVAEKAIPACNIVVITGEEMKKDVEGYLKALYDQNPQSIGGAMPDDAFYLIRA